jgi:hypothetical protein
MRGLAMRSGQVVSGNRLLRWERPRRLGAPSRLAAIGLSWRPMFNFRMPPLVLAIVVSAPAVLPGQLARSGDYSRAVQVALAELLVILIAGAISAQRRID